MADTLTTLKLHDP